MIFINPVLKKMMYLKKCNMYVGISRERYEKQILVKKFIVGGVTFLCIPFANNLIITSKIYFA